MALNDMISLLDETFAKLQDIKAFQGEAVNQIHWIFSFPDRHERTVNNEQNKKLGPNFLYLFKRLLWNVYGCSERLLQILSWMKISKRN